MTRAVKRTLGVAVLLVVVGVLAIPKLVSSTEEGPARSGGGRPGSRDTLQVRAHVVSTDLLTDRILTTGTLRANESVELASEASGKLVRVLFEEGSPVQQGQLLVKINDADLQAQLERAKYRIELAEKREERQRQILDKGGISQEDYELALNEVNVLRSEIEVIEAQIAKTEIHAPFSGAIGLRYVSEGAFISPQTRIATLQDLDPIKIDFAVPEKYMGRVRPGGEILFRVEGTDETFRGRIYAVEPEINQNTRTLQLRAESPNPGLRFFAGAFANIELILEEIDAALTVPSIAVVPELQGQKVYLYQNGKVMSRSVETGIRTDSTVQIVQGLAPGDTVITSGLQQIRPGLPVRIDEAAI